MKLFENNGAHVLVDGQFGSTGKGLFASFLARKAAEHGARFDAVISNAGPNSGHTFYHEGEKHVLKQLPTFAVKTMLMGAKPPVTILSAGSVVDPSILRKEALKYPDLTIYVSPQAAVIDDEAKRIEGGGSIAAVAGTQSGTGYAIARKIMRDPKGVWGGRIFDMPKNVRTLTGPAFIENTRVFVEVSQGFSLGIHSDFYPKATSRECTVMQAITDARIAPRFVTKTYMVIRTYPIRVGDHNGNSSGGFYPDQEEINWSDIGVEPELTTVTQRIRRVFTFSNFQYREALMANQPDIVLVNFMNYLKNPVVEKGFIKNITHIGAEAMPYRSPHLLFGRGPHDHDISLY